MYSQRKIFIRYAIAGILLGSAFLHQWVWPLALVGLVVWFLTIAKTGRGRDAFWGGWITGTAKMLLVLSWYWTTYPLPAMNVHPLFVAAFIICVYWLVTSVVIGLGFALSGVLSWWCGKRLSPWLRVLALPALLVCGEILGSVAFSINALGPGGGINTYFSFGYVGYLLNNHQLLRYGALFGGVYTLSFLAGLIAAGAYEAFVTKRRGAQTIVAILLMAAAMSAAVSISLPARAPLMHTRVALISSDFSQETEKNSTTTAKERAWLEEAVEAAFVYDPQYIVLPEASGLTRGTDASTTLEWLSSKGKKVVLIDSARVDQEDGTARVRAFIYDTASSGVYTADKHYLVPQGEYIPYFYEFLFGVLGTKDFFKDRTSAITYRSGAKGEYGEAPDYIPAVLFCSESIPPLSVFEMRLRRDIPFVVHPVSHSWFHSPQVLWNEMRDMVALHALGNQLPIMQAGNMAPTLGFDAQGHLLSPIAQKSYIHTRISIYDL